MSTKTVFMLPGQGSQFRNMGRQAYEQNPTFRRVLDGFAELALPTLGISITDLFYSDANPSQLNRSRVMHPALFAFHYAWAKAFEADGIVPDLWLGYSLGEITACALAGALVPADAFNIVIEIGRLVETHSAPAGMMAILASPEIMRQEPDLFRSTTLACDNYSQHFVVTGGPARLRQLQTILRSREMLAEILPIDRGFHSNFLDPIQPHLTALSTRLRVRPFAQPVLSCSLGRILTVDDLRTDFFWQSHRRPVYFHDTLSRLDQAGPAKYLDLSATGTLAAFARRILPEPARARATLNPLGPNQRDLANLRHW